MKLVHNITKVSHILPSLAMFLTQKQRYPVEIKWSDKSWVHNIFRIWEMLFWRKAGIRCESSTTSDGRVSLYTFEAICAYVETLIRNFFEIKWLDVKIYNLQLAIASGNGTEGIRIPWISFAIALDVANKGTQTSTSPITWSHTCTGSNLILAVGVSASDSTDTAVVSASSYNSVALTKARADHSISGSNEVDGSIWLLGAPNTGANTTSVTFSGGSTVNCIAGAVSYTGTSASSTADAKNGTTGTTTGAKTVTVTTVADNCWVIWNLALYVVGAGPNITLPTQTQRWIEEHNSADNSSGQDTNAAVTPAGNSSGGWTIGGVAPNFALTGVSFAPAAGGAATISSLPILGTG